MGDSKAFGLPWGGKRTKAFLRIAVSVVVLYVLFRKLDWGQAAKVVEEANLWVLALPVLVGLVDRCWMAWKWRMLLDVLGPAPSLYDAIRVYYVSSFQGIAIPLGGLGADLVRYAHLRSSDISRHSVAISIVVERVIGVLATGMVAVVACLILLQKVGAIGESHVLNWLLWGGVAGSVALAVVLFSTRLQRVVYRLLNRSRLLAESATFNKLADALRKYRDAPGVVLLNLGLSVIEQLFPVVSFYLGSIAFQIPVTFLECLAVVPASVLIQRLPVSYAGLGLREGALVFLFGLLNVAYADVLVWSSAMFITFLVSLLPGALWSFDRSSYYSNGVNSSADMSLENA